MLRGQDRVGVETGGNSEGRVILVLELVLEHLMPKRILQTTVFK